MPERAALIMGERELIRERENSGSCHMRVLTNLRLDSGSMFVSTVRTPSLKAGFFRNSFRMRSARSMTPLSVLVVSIDTS